jgi:hypothetical protein
MKLRELPPGVTTGGYILHAGPEKWHGGDAGPRRSTP